MSDKKTVFEYYAMNESIQRIVIGVQNLKFRMDIEREHYMSVRNPEIDYLEAVKRHAKHSIMDMISDFILVEETNEGPYLEATLHLPYVRDAKIKELESLAEDWRKSCKARNTELIKLRNQVNLLRRPWWKKIIKINK